ncbi:uncharacterized protein FMAN_01600 [Fusarium mangiferae]|uniref:Uncharacterized protein n=1 Tax=Fusarium mangiferae TaxID=192010 RepID=A0A1L7SNZ8_FUSMA|nr:uncharacterized protein FMAN_01600 [Fusarium mangiferae]CVK84648.1 uncharacterized protein FMAN_01600 [Fusarium mangiferae]
MASPSPPTSTFRNIQEKATAYIHEADFWLNEAENRNSTLAVTDWRNLCLRPPIFFLNSAPPTLYFQTPFNELAPRKKVVYVWICCQCGHGGMKITVDPCPYCGVPRCANCDTRRFNSRLNTSNPYPESEDLSCRLPLSTLTYLSRQPNYTPPEIILQGADTKLNLGLFLPVRTILVGDLAREGEEGEEEKT